VHACPVRSRGDVFAAKPLLQQNAISLCPPKSRKSKGMRLYTDVKEILFTADQLNAHVKELGHKISTDYRGQSLVLVGILNGWLPFLYDLLGALDLPVSHDLIELSSYGQSTVSSGIVRILKDVAIDISGKDVLLVEDIVDTGLTLHTAIKHFRFRKPASLKTCALLDKPTRRRVAIKPDYHGFTIPDVFVVGYGLDCAENHRELPYIGVLKVKK
jgi:hypoxanthine phosphoribosyltransferase